MIWSPYDGEDGITPITKIHLNIPQVKSMSWQNNILCVQSSELELFLLNTSDSFELIRSYQSILEYSLDENGSSLALLNNDRFLTIINLQNEITLMELQFNSTVTNLNWRSNHSELYLINSETEIGRISIPNENYTSIIEENNSITDVDFSYNGDLLCYSLLNLNIYIHAFNEERIINSFVRSIANFGGDLNTSVAWKNNNLIAIIENTHLILWDIDLDSKVTTEVIGTVSDNGYPVWARYSNLILGLFLSMIIVVVFLIYKKNKKPLRNRS
jgi:hypothetical protein